MARRRQIAALLAVTLGCGFALPPPHRLLPLRAELLYIGRDRTLSASG